MTSITRLLCIASVAILSACAVPPDETPQQRADRINRGVATGATLYVIAGITALIIVAGSVEAIVDGD